MTRLVSRRRVLSIAVGVGTAATVGAFAPQEAGAADGGGVAKVDEKDSLAVALGYVADAGRVDAKTNSNYQAGTSCSGCSWYQGKAGDTGGPCTFFPGKQVAAQGWCRMWSKKQ